MDEMVLVSVDDHVVEPPDMFARHVPQKWAEQAPHVVVGDNGVDQWVYRGRPTGVSGLNAVVSWPEEYGGRDASLWEWLIFEEEYYRAGAPQRVTQNGIFLLAPTASLRYDF